MGTSSTHHHLHQRTFVFFLVFLTTLLTPKFLQPRYSNMSALFMSPAVVTITRGAFVGTPLRTSPAAPVRVGAVKTVRAEVQTSSADADVADAVPPPPKFCAGLAGATGPMGEFDPAGFLKDKDQNTIRRYREAEVTHGRVCMLASLGIIVGETFNPLFDGAITGPAINQFQQVPGPFWTALVFAIGLAEARRATTGWINPVGMDPEPGEDTLFTLREGYTPGDIGYDPLGLKPNNEADLMEMQNKELNNGRLAMIATAGMVVQELITQTPVMDQFKS